MAKTEPPHFTPPNFRKEWLNGRWVPVAIDADEGAVWEFDLKYPEKTDIYLERDTEARLKKGEETRLDLDSETRLDRERKEIRRRYELDKGYELDKKRLESGERLYYGHHPYSRLDSFGFTLEKGYDELKAADDKMLKSSLARFEKREKEIKMARRKKAEKPNPFRKGRATGVKSGGGQFLRLGEGDSVVFAPMQGLDEMISADMHEYWDLKPAIYHPCIGRNCPGCLVDNEARFKAYLPVLVKSTGDPAIYPFTISVYNQLEALEDEIMEDDPAANLKGFVTKVSRKGAGMATRYSVMGVGSRIDLTDAEIPDFIPQLGPSEESDIWDLLEKNGYDRNDFVTVETPAISPADADAAGDDWGDA